MFSENTEAANEKSRELTRKQFYLQSLSIDFHRDRQ